MGSTSLGRDQIHNSLRLSKTELAVQKGSLCEFACRCGRCAAVIDGMENLFGHEDTAVAGYLAHVLARVGMGRSEHCQDSIVKLIVRFIVH